MQEIEIKEFNEDLFTSRINDSNLEIIEKFDLEYTNFFENFMTSNVPCVIKNVSSSWECTAKWINNDKINTGYFKERYGDLEAPVADCDNITYSAQCKIIMKVKDYMQYLENSERDKLLYLKDWHLRRLEPNDNFYEVPLIFCSDWLNEFAIDHGEDDFMFVYIGPKDSWTPLHSDVYHSYSWSVNIVGKKKWIFFPPGEEDKLKDSFGNLPLLFNSEKFESVKFLEIIQDKGDAIFVPSGWHHQVVNLLDTISVNHNWINGCNIQMVWKALNSSMVAVENEIIEFKNTPEYTSQCQLILKSLFGMDFLSFADFLIYIGKKRLAQLQGKQNIYYNKYRLGINHIKFDLASLLKTINLINNHPQIVSKYLSPTIECSIINLKIEISKIFQ